MEKEFLEKINTEVQTKLDEFKENLSMYSREDADKFEASIKAQLDDAGNENKEALKKLEDILIKHGELLKSDGESKPVSLAEHLKSRNEDLVKAKDGKTFEMEFKTTVTTSTVTDSTVNDRITAVHMPDLNDTPLMQIIPKYQLGVNMGGSRRYIDMASYTSNSDYKNENTALGEDAVTFNEYSISVVKIGTTIPITEEFFYDYDLLASEIKNRLLAEHAVKVDESLLTGDGVAPNVKGVNTYAQAFTVGSGYQNTVVIPNIYDLILNMKSEISAGKTKYMPDYAIVNPADMYEAMSTKNELGDYIKPPYVSNDYMNAAGIKMIESNAQTADVLTVGDFRWSELIQAGGVVIQVGYNSSGDFGKGVLTLRAVQRLALLIRNIDVTGFKKVASIETELTSLEKVIS